MSLGSRSSKRDVYCTAAWFPKVSWVGKPEYLYQIIQK